MRIKFLIGLVLLAGACATGTVQIPAVAPQTTALATAPSPAQINTFGALTNLIGKSFKGTQIGASKNPQIDIQTWSWALGGNAILIAHALADGSYGGDSYVYKDAATGGLVYVYITSAGFRTEGTITLAEDGSFIAEEDVLGHPSITKVRSTSHMTPDGPGTMRSEYLENDIWIAGHGFDYAPTDALLPVITLQAQE